ncbi:Na-translocating system protein MpsC family protein [Neobacillus terrae]|uniref:Na-translocating system protein MpsC family protein n=1 Tax=Neobacillus terrae TaxID=3034837 RepID=UPI00140A8048|nr:Na-translocating system protein MpsC family protein [Neobacillus terrae]NHM29397.1 DUF2294 family protein [Neobacillus terrae]
MEIKKKETEMSSFVGRVLRDNFGRGPGNVFCTFSTPFIVFHISNFLSPMEKSLMMNDKAFFVHKTRDLMMETLLLEIKSQIELITEKKVIEFYYDWNLEAKTGMFLAVTQDIELASEGQTNSYTNEEKVNQEMIQVSKEVEKPPGEITSLMLNPRTLIFIREKILVPIEKELIHFGCEETLKIVKRNLEKRVLYLHVNNFEEYLNVRITDYFVDWKFEEDKSYTIFMLKP